LFLLCADLPKHFAQSFGCSIVASVICVLGVFAGIWHFTFADLPSYQRLAANVFFASPPTSTYEEALRHFERAESIQVCFTLSFCPFSGEMQQKCD
jgi:hypothetical protein